MDRDGVWKFPEGSGRQGTVEGIAATSSVVPEDLRGLRDERDLCYLKSRSERNILGQEF